MRIPSPKAWVACPVRATCRASWRSWRQTARCSSRGRPSAHPAVSRWFDADRGGQANRPSAAQVLTVLRSHAARPNTQQGGKTMMNRRHFSASMGALALSPSVFAQSAYPQRPITLVVPFSAGSVVDVQARLIARALSDNLGQPIVIDNRVGVSGSIGADFVAMYGLTGNANVMVCNPNTKFKSVADVIEFGKQQPGKLNFGSGGNGTSAHLCLELLQTQTGARFNHIPYKATTAALVDLIAGNVDVLFDYVQTSRAHIRDGKINALAVTSTSRLAALPNVPTMG